MRLARVVLGAPMLIAMLTSMACSSDAKWAGRFTGGVRRTIVGVETQSAIELLADREKATIRKIYVNGSGQRFDYHCKGEISVHAAFVRVRNIECDKTGS